jgi:hypothetical protein
MASVNTFNPDETELSEEVKEEKIIPQTTEKGAAAEGKD